MNNDTLLERFKQHVASPLSTTRYNDAATLDTFVEHIAEPLFKLDKFDFNSFLNLCEAHNLKFADYSDYYVSLVDFLRQKHVIRKTKDSDGTYDAYERQ